MFALYLPGAELTLHASVHGADGAERQMLFEALSCLVPEDVLILNRGYPAAWLVAQIGGGGNTLGQIGIGDNTLLQQDKKTVHCSNATHNPSQGYQ